MIKSEEVYTELAPWMIGEKVEIGLYEKSEDGATGKYYGCTAGTLVGYSEQDGVIGALFDGSDKPMVSTVQTAILVTVVEAQIS